METSQLRLFRAVISVIRQMFWYRESSFVIKVTRAKFTESALVSRNINLIVAHARKLIANSIGKLRPTENWKSTKTVYFWHTVSYVGTYELNYLPSVGRNFFLCWQLSVVQFWTFDFSKCHSFVMFFVAMTPRTFVVFPRGSGHFKLGLRVIFTNPMPRRAILSAETETPGSVHLFQGTKQLIYMKDNLSELIQTLFSLFSPKLRKFVVTA